MPYSATKNVTFTLPTSLMQEVRELVNQGKKPSINGLVREALERYMVEMKREEIRQDMLEASQDPLFNADVNDCKAAFHNTDKENMPEW
jgi:Arc/MetJ-type ribon-helix-helix transcriptional regulator